MLRHTTLPRSVLGLSLVVISGIVLLASCEEVVTVTEVVTDTFVTPVTAFDTIVVTDTLVLTDTVVVTDPIPLQWTVRDTAGQPIVDGQLYPVSAPFEVVVEAPGAQYTGIMVWIPAQEPVETTFARAAKASDFTELLAVLNELEAELVPFAVNEQQRGLGVPMRIRFFGTGTGQLGIQNGRNGELDLIALPPAPAGG